MSKRTIDLVGRVVVGEHIYSVGFRETQMYYIDSDGMKFHKVTGEVMGEEIENYYDVQLAVETLESKNNYNRRLLSIGDEYD